MRKGRPFAPKRRKPIVPKSREIANRRLADVRAFDKLAKAGLNRVRDLLQSPEEKEGE